MDFVSQILQEISRQEKLYSLSKAIVSIETKKDLDNNLGMNIKIKYDIDSYLKTCNLLNTKEEEIKNKKLLTEFINVEFKRQYLSNLN